MEPTNTPETRPAKTDTAQKPEENKKTDVLEWEADEFSHYPKTAGWYIGFVIVAAGLIAFAVWENSLMTIILFGLAVLLLFIFAHRKPKRIKHQLSGTGIRLGEAFYPYKSIPKFWINYNPPVTKTLNIETAAYINNHIIIQLGDQDPIRVKQFLQKYIEEDLDREEGLTEIITKFLKL